MADNSEETTVAWQRPKWTIETLAELLLDPDSAAEIAEGADGEIIINTGVKEDEDGNLVFMS